MGAPVTSVARELLALNLEDVASGHRERDPELRWRYLQARSWLADNDDGPAGLRAVCSELGLSPRAVRREVRRAIREWR